MLRLNWTHEQTWYVSCGCVVPAMACMASSHSTQHPAPSTPRSPLSIERWASLSTAQKIFQFPNLKSQFPETRKGSEKSRMASHRAGRTT